MLTSSTSPCSAGWKRLKDTQSCWSWMTIPGWYRQACWILHCTAGHRDSPSAVLPASWRSSVCHGGPRLPLPE
eukprot:7251052-Prorocentrum_lima.AAC.1